jgi:flagellar basal body L-ring protein FlgH
VKKMKRMLIVMVALLAIVAFASGVIAQAPAKTETPAAAPVAPAPAPAPEKPKMAKPMKFWGTVAAYEAGKMITVKGRKDKEMAFDVTGDTKMKGEVKEGVKVTVMYKKDGDKMTATSISVNPPPKKKAAPKES